MPGIRPRLGTGPARRDRGRPFPLVPVPYQLEFYVDRVGNRRVIRAPQPEGIRRELRVGTGFRYQLG